MQGSKVSIVGAGPGDSRYLTQEARDCLQQAEVLVHDALVDDSLLELVPPNCERIDVGKRGGQPSPSQPEIDQLLVQLCQSGKRVVRLKSGDPFIFGRTTSEIQALRAVGCDYAVLPGLSSALAAPLLAGIPLTDPVLSRGFAVYTVHEPDALNWELLAGLETLVLLMGGRQLRRIVQELLRHGRSPHTPLAVIQRAGQLEQQVWAGTLETILPLTADQTLSPCVIVIGEVVALREFIVPHA
jgi:uroporphyrin-III C-methyltransferase